jgi:IS5 family transposase
LQGQGLQAQRVRKDGEVAGGGEPDHHRLQGLHAAADDSDLLLAAIRRIKHCWDTLHLVAADAAFYSVENEAAAKAKGVKRVCIPNRSTKSLERKREQRSRWFRSGQKWRTGCEGRISVVKRRHGLRRCRYKGYVGMNR